MDAELDNKLCQKYPKIFKDRYADMRTTAMCWGFEHDSGWYNILDKLCANIQGHIDWARQQRLSSIKYNRALKRALRGDKSRLIEYYTLRGQVTEWTMERVDADIARAEYRKVEDKVPQVVAVQVKEKFGTLRFYYNGGNRYIDGLVSMAESMSAVTCEVCGNQGKSTGGGWIKTVCVNHVDSY